MGPLLFVAAGLVALIVAALTLRSFGPRYRVGRLLSATRAVSIAEARRIAEAAESAYVKISGRIDAEDPFEDADHRPLVLRRTRFLARDGRDWAPFEESREQVEFELHEGLDAIGVDGPALGEGLVVVARESEGVAGDVADRAPSDMPPATPVRAIIEQVSAVDHAIVVGVPAIGTGGTPIMTAGHGRPLVLTTLQTDEAMRILAGGSSRPRFAAACLIAGAALIVGGLAWAGLLALSSGLGAVGPLLAILSGFIVPVALAATPTPAAGGDPRSSGEGPGLVGEPGLAILAVAAIAIVSVVVTTLWVRLTHDPSRDAPSRDSGHR
ncbi:MAG: hypothetical protein ACJ765_10475 [Chloroflexota bacterium]